jgi:hypothetical protein
VNEIVRSGSSGSGFSFCSAVSAATVSCTAGAASADETEINRTSAAVAGRAGRMIMPPGMNEWSFGLLGYDSAKYDVTQLAMPAIGILSPGFESWSIPAGAGG